MALLQSGQANATASPNWLRRANAGIASSFFEFRYQSPVSNNLYAEVHTLIQINAWCTRGKTVC
jgi:hypothetical protein